MPPRTSSLDGQPGKGIGPNRTTGSRTTMVTLESLRVAERARSGNAARRSAGQGDSGALEARLSHYAADPAIIDPRQAPLPGRFFAVLFFSG